ncbi:MAG: hypothetical protein O9284_14900 [Steroidobacteraceae bacterium]|jgi:hypothetical protein|nr:hypothetical protein [Steroidobacteraceae bacterium]
MPIFIDTEFTDLRAPQLISLGLVAEDGREFYAERCDLPVDACTPFVERKVLPLLGATCREACEDFSMLPGMRRHHALHDARANRHAGRAHVRPAMSA